MIRVPIVKKSLVLLPLCLALAFLLLMPCAGAQEPLATILDRGYVAHWLVCGPFPSDIGDGIAGALQRGAPALGSRDFMAPLGGISRTRPQHLLEVRTDSGEAIWQRAGTTDASLDLGPFFPDTAEGVSYAAFYAENDQERNVYVNLHTPLGARVWLNGFRLRDVVGAPLPVLGVDRFVATFRAGMNLMVFEVPGATFETLAAGAGVGVQTLRSDVLRNRTLLQGKSGFEIALQLAAVERLGNIVYVPRLVSPGTFTSGAAGLRQDALLTLFNPTGLPSPTIRVTAEAGGTTGAAAATVAPFPPDAEQQVRLAIPTGDAQPGDAVSVKVTLATPDASATFTAPVTVVRPTESGKVYVVTGSRHAAAERADQRTETEAFIAAFRRQGVFLDQEPDYGFDLGDADQWGAALAGAPEVWPAVRDAARTGRCAARAGYTTPDERLVGEETLVRNLVYGVLGSRAALEDASQVYFAWDAPAVAPQTPQLLREAGIPGLVSNVRIPGLPAFFMHLGLDGEPVPHRHKNSGPGPASFDSLHEMTTTQRRELLEQGIAGDILVVENLLPPPEPFYLGNSAALRQAVPSVLITGAGAHMFFEDVRTRYQEPASRLPESGRLLTTVQPGEIIAQPVLKQTFAATECALLQAEKAATCAAVAGAAYPEAALDLAWRHLLYWSASRRLTFVTDGRMYADMLAGLREAHEIAAGVTQNALDFLARQAETLAHAPKPTDSSRVLLVFNSTARPRTDVCEILLRWPRAGGIAVVDGRGEPQSILVDRMQPVGDHEMKGRIRFVARDVPAIGYDVYYVTTSGSAAPSRRKDPQIENERWFLALDPATGAVRSLLDKSTGKELSSGLLNHVAALQESAEHTDNGRECWTTGERDYAVSAPDTIETVVVDGMQELTVTSPFRGGRLVRRITMYRDVARIDCETSFEGVDLSGRMLAITFAVGGEGRVAVFGERFGAVAGRRSPGVLDFRTSGTDNPSGAALAPAWRWVAVSPSDYIQIGQDGAAPLLPCAIVYGGDAALETGARSIQRALVRRGIPASMCPDTPRRSTAPWTDSTEFAQLNDDLAHGAGMRIAVGGPDQNALTKRLFDRLPEESRAALEERFKQGAAALLYDAETPPGFPPTPTLVLGGGSPNHTANFVRDAAESILNRGTLALPEAAFVGEAVPKRQNGGLALLFQGAALCSLEADGTLVLLLAHDGDVASHAEFRPAARNLTFRYALLPLEETWREAGTALAAQAFNEPLAAVENDIHPGRLPARFGFCEGSNADFVVTAWKPAGYAAAAFERRAPHPINGIIMRGYESTGRIWRGNFRFFAPLRQAGTADLFDDTRQPLAVAESVLDLEAPPLAVENVWLLPQSRFGRGDAEELAPDMPVKQPVQTRYWVYNAGAAPIHAREFALTLRGDLRDADAPVKLHIANFAADRAIEGVVYLATCEGWSVTPAQIYYGLGPGDENAYEFMVLRERNSGGAGGLAAWTEIDGTTYRDTLLESSEPMKLETRRTENQLRVSVHNKTGIPAEGYVEVIAAPAYWEHRGASTGSEAPPARTGVLPVEPRRAPVSVGAFQRQELLFRCPAEAAADGVVVKLCAHNCVMYEKME